MSSLLLRIPYDVLLKITYLSASDAICRAPTELLAMRLTCKTLHQHLNVTNSAQLYARLFQRHFDLSPLLQHSITTNVNDSTLAAEYVLRQQLLARSRTSSWSDACLASDMWTALRMLAESECRNVKQLIAANFPRELLQLARIHLQPRHSCAMCGGASASQPLKHVFVWLFSLTLSKSAIARMTSDIRDETCKLLRPYASSAKQPPPSGGVALTAACLDLRCKAPSCGGIITSSNGGAPSTHQHHHQEPAPTLYTRRDIPVEYLNPAFAAVNIMMATKESSSLLIPPHLPENRAIATLRNVSGPTMEDFRQFQSYQTPLFADSLCDYEQARSSPGGVASDSSEDEACARPPPHCRTVPQALATTHGSTRLGRSSRSHDPEFAHVYGFSDPAVPAPKAFSGLWQGSYMTSAVNEAGEEVYSNRRPLQAVFTEYHCFSPNIPIPSTHDASELASLPARPWEVDDLPNHRYEILDGAGTTSLERGSILESPDTVSQFTEGGTSSQHQTQSPSSTGRSIHETPAIVDTILFGETTPDHDEAWKGFRYVGRIYGDGRVYLKREPKFESEDYLGTWMFEGKLRFDKVIVGFWKSQHSSEEQVAKGIFSLTKATAC